MKKTILLTVFALLSLNLLFAQEIICKGTIIDAESKFPLQGATVQAKTGHSATQTDLKGYFEITAGQGDSLLISSVGYKSLWVAIQSLIELPTIELSKINETLEEVTIVNTGYQQLSKERATGSFQFVNQELFDRSVSTNVIDRLENTVSGLIFNKGDAEKTDPFLIRGRSTITADAQPLIILDDFPYDGDLDNLNPNTIESVTILRDAAAASIWGARAGNGVIVITTKKGSTHVPKVTFRTSVIARNKPDLSNISIISSADRVEWEKLLFESGNYNNAIAGNTLTSRGAAIPEAVELMIANPANLQEQLQKLAQQDVYADLSKYFYRREISQQHDIAVSGKTHDLSYSFSAGYLKNLESLVGNSHDRISLRSSNQYTFNKRLKADVSMIYTQSQNLRGGNEGVDFARFNSGLSPYAKLVGEDGEALPYYHLHRKPFLDTVGSGNLLDWTYRPYEEIYLKNSKEKIRDILVNSGVQFTILNGLTAGVKYQFENQLGTTRDVNGPDAYSARYTINRFSQVAQNGSVNYIVPLGGTLQSDIEEIQTHQGRFQINYSKNWNLKHEVNAIGGYEIRNRIITAESTFRYGYDEGTYTFNPKVDLVNWYPVLDGQYITPIPEGVNKMSKYTDNFLSYYFNGAYSYDNKYTLSASMRKDEANLFGVNSNMKGTPLWSLGLAWMISNEPFFKNEAIPYLKIRTTYGVNGNISRMASAKTVTQKFSAGTTHNYPTQSIMSPPNKNLRWEKVNLLNIGIDFSTKNNRINGTIEYYHKLAEDLLAATPTDPTMGFASVYANVASMTGKGVDVNLNSTNIGSALFKWTTTLLYSYTSNKVTDFYMPITNMGSTYLTSLSSITPAIGKPLYSVYSYPWAGLNPETGAPRVFIDGKESEDYSQIYNYTPLSQLQYHGSVQPTHFGALRNGFAHRNFGLSFTVSYKFGYYFRTATVYNSGLNNAWTAHGDFGSRWQKPGDELRTHVPSMLYPANTLRDNVYQYSSVHIHRADNIRLEDILFTYDFIPVKEQAFEKIRIFLSLSELGPLWYANNAGIDPYYNNIVLQRTKISIGANVNF